MKHAIINNLPKNPKEIYDLALNKSFKFWVDEKGTFENPGHFQRKPSKLNYEEAFELIKNNKPHWVVSFRNESYINPKLNDYWEFGRSNIGNCEYGDVYIWIQVDIIPASLIFTKFDLNINWY